MTEHMSHDERKRTEALFDADMEWKLTFAARLTRGCEVCPEYMRNRREEILPRLIDKALLENKDASDVVHDFLSAVHRRHLEGATL